MALNRHGQRQWSNQTRIALFKSLAVMFEADDCNGHDNHGDNISRWGTPWTHNRALNAELAQAQSVAKVLSYRYGKRVLVIRVNSDNGSRRMPENDLGCHTRAKMVADIIKKVEKDQTPFPQKKFLDI